MVCSGEMCGCVHLERFRFALMEAFDIHDMCISIAEQPWAVSLKGYIPGQLFGCFPMLGRCWKFLRGCWSNFVIVCIVLIMGLFEAYANLS